MFCVGTHHFGNDSKGQIASDHILDHRSEGFPARDIWFLGVIVPGQDQMERVLGKPPSPSPPSPSLGNSCRHSGQETMITGFPKVLGSWWEIFENGDRGSTAWEAIFEKMTFFKQCTLFETGHVHNFQTLLFFRDKSPAGCHKT